MSVKPAVGQVWEEADAHKSIKRRFVIVEFIGWKGTDPGCVMYYGHTSDGFAPNPKTGRKARRFFLHQNELNGKQFKFTGELVDIPTSLHDYPPSKSYGL